MVPGLAVAIALLAGSPDAAAAAPDPQPPATKTVEAPCVTPLPDGDSREIVVCAERPQGYRLNRDVMEAHREKHGAGRPTPRQTMKDESCQVVGEMGCTGPGTGSPR